MSTKIGAGIGAGRWLDPGTLRLGLFVGGLVVALIAGFGIGQLNARDGADGGAAGTAAPASGGAVADHTHEPGTAPHHHHGAATGSDAEVGGLSLSGSGHTLAPLTTVFPVGIEQDFRFVVRDAERRPVTGFAVVHDKPLHLIVARRDLAGYQHLHPTMAPDGTWSIPLTLPEPGVWRAYADFSVLPDGGQQLPLTLGIDLVAPGDYQPRPLPAAAREATIDGFTVTYQGTPGVGATAPLLFRVFSNGTPVTDLQPYLGAYGHLVALRDGDLGYLHVHPEELLDANGGVKFWLALPGPGSYRLFLDFQVAGVVRTAEFTLTA